MNLRQVFVLLFLPALGSCKLGNQNNAASQQSGSGAYRAGTAVKNSTSVDTLKYTFATIKMRASDCGSKPDSECSLVCIKYPVFDNSRVLNDSIKHRFFCLFFWEKAAEKDTSLTMYARNFIDGYEKVKNDTQRDPKGTYTLDCSAEVRKQYPGLVTIQISGTKYDGAAHGIDGYCFINWDRKSARPVKLQDIFKDDYRDALAKIAEKTFKRQEQLSDTASLANYLFKDGRFVLANNFLITETGVTFLYNEYEAKAYSDGATEVQVPYSKIKLLLRPNTVISPIIKHAGI